MTFSILGFFAPFKLFYPCQTRVFLQAQARHEAKELESLVQNEQITRCVTECQRGHRSNIVFLSFELPFSCVKARKRSSSLGACKVGSQGSDSRGNRCSQVMICFDICDLHLPVIGYLAKTAPHREPFPGCENLVEIDLKRSMIGLCEVAFAKLSEAAHLCPYARAHVCTGASLLWSKGRNFSIQVGAGSFKLFIVDLFCWWPRYGSTALRRNCKRILLRQC